MKNVFDRYKNVALYIVITAAAFLLFLHTAPLNGVGFVIISILAFVTSIGLFIGLVFSVLGLVAEIYAERYKSMENNDGGSRAYKIKLRDLQKQKRKAQDQLLINRGRPNMQNDAYLALTRIERKIAEHTGLD